MKNLKDKEFGDILEVSEGDQNGSAQSFATDDHHALSDIHIQEVQQRLSVRCPSYANTEQIQKVFGKVLA